ncbi:MAG: Lon protease, partial [Candidatus Daviesbacteria bacterium GW2011_GWA1_38_7]
MSLDPTTQPIKLRPSLPVAPLRGTVIFPGNNVPIVSGRVKSKAALDAAYDADRLIVFVTQKNDRIDDPKDTDLFQVGTVCLIRRILKVDGEYQVSAEGLVRVFIKRYVQSDSFFEAEIEELPELYEKSEETEAMVRSVREQLRRYLELGGNPLFDPIGLSNLSLLSSNDDPNQLVNLICQAIDFKTIDKQQILEMVSSVDRLKRLSEILAKEQGYNAR